jgi:hypothetical protein
VRGPEANTSRAGRKSSPGPARAGTSLLPSAANLVWIRHGTEYEAKSVSEPKRVLLNFARHLHQVR